MKAANVADSVIPIQKFVFLIVLFFLVTLGLASLLGLPSNLGVLIFIGMFVSVGLGLVKIRNVIILNTFPLSKNIALEFDVDDRLIVKCLDTSNHIATDLGRLLPLANYLLIKKPHGQA